MTKRLEQNTAFSRTRHSAHRRLLDLGKSFAMPRCGSSLPGTEVVLPTKTAALARCNWEDMAQA